MSAVDQIPPLVSEAAAAKVASLIDDATAQGAIRTCGKERSGALVPRTVLTDATGVMRVMREEAFGPVVAVQCVQNLDEGIREINAVSGAIHHGVYTQSIDTAMDLADRIRAAGVIVNGPGTWRVDHMPYGGVGSSGSGREGARFAIEEFTELKTIVIRPTRT